MSRRQALVLAGHGSLHHPRSAPVLHAHADRIRENGPFDEVRTAFWKEEPTLRDVRSIVDGDVAYVVPVLTSEGYFADEVFPRELGVDGGSDRARPAVAGPELRYAEPVGTHPAMTDVVVERVETTRTGPADRVGVVVVGHGTERNERSARSTREHARRLRDRERYAEVDVAFLDEPPYVDSALERTSAEEIVVVPLFVADGHHTTEDVPAALGHPGIGESTRIDGRPVHYTGAVGTEPRLADVLVERAVEAGADQARRPPPDRLGAAGSAFRRWLEARDERVEWGELSIATGEDTYAITHRVDAAVPPEELAKVEGPAALRERVRHDDDGGYRPLSGARSLPSGWRLAGLDAVELVRSVRAVYPGSIAHWHRERRGDLTPTDLSETVDRQTGLYADLARLDADAVSATTEAVCGDCVRSRRWGTDDEASAGPDAEEHSIPCREACPFFLSAAHAFLESGDSAAAEPDAGVPVGAFDDPANRYRVRFVRAIERRTAPDTPSPATGGGR